MTGKDKVTRVLVTIMKVVTIAKTWSINQKARINWSDSYQSTLWINEPSNLSAVLDFLFLYLIYHMVIQIFLEKSQCFPRKIGKPTLHLDLFHGQCPIQFVH